MVRLGQFLAIISDGECVVTESFLVLDPVSYQKRPRTKGMAFTQSIPPPISICDQIDTCDGRTRCCDLIVSPHRDIWQLEILLAVSRSPNVGKAY